MSVLNNPYLERNCVHCGSRFTPSDPLQRFCSLQCRDAERSGRAVGATRSSETCRVCGQGFSPRTNAQKYCSPKCRVAANAKPAKEPKDCARCGRTFTPRVLSQKYCSTCSGLPDAVRGGEARVRVCACGRSFIPRTEGQTHCSPGCLDAARPGTALRSQKRHGSPAKQEVTSKRRERELQNNGPQPLADAAASTLWTCPSCGLEQSEEAFPTEGAPCWDCLGGRPARQMCGYCEHFDSGGSECADCLNYAWLALHAWKRQPRRDGESPVFELVLPQRVWDAADHVCCICMLPTIEGSPSGARPVMEHLIPKARGGTHTYPNVGCAHQLCSAAKAEGANPIDIRNRIISVIESAYR